MIRGIFSIPLKIAEFEQWILNFLFGWTIPYFNAFGAYCQSCIVAIDQRFPIIGKILHPIGVVLTVLFGLFMCWFMIGMILSIPFMTIFLFNIGIEMNMAAQNQHEEVIACYESNRITNMTLIKMVDGDFWGGFGELTGIGATRCLWEANFYNGDEPLMTEL